MLILKIIGVVVLILIGIMLFLGVSALLAAVIVLSCDAELKEEQKDEEELCQTQAKQEK